MKSTIYIGDRVRFDSKRGLIVGTVTAIKIQRPGSRNALVHLYGLPIISIRVLTVAQDKGGAWTVAERHCTKIGRAKELAKAIDQVSAIERQIRDVRENRKRELHDEAAKVGVFDCVKGDPIEVQFRGGYWASCKFMKLTATGMVGYYREGDFIYDALGLTQKPRVRFVAPQFVRLQKEKA